MPAIDESGEMPVFRANPQPEQDSHRVLRLFRWHGLEVVPPSPTVQQAVTNCPFCGKEQKFYLQCETGKWDCKVCGRSGNPVTFLRQWHEYVADNQQGYYGRDYSELLGRFAGSRGLLVPETLIMWGVCLNPLRGMNGEWMVPGYGNGMKLDQIYTYTRIRKKAPTKADPNRVFECPALLPTPGIPDPHSKHGVFGHFKGLFDPAKPNLYVCEGPWDAMILWETMSRIKKMPIGSGAGDNTELGYYPTSDINNSLLQNSNVIGFPGANIFNEHWADVFADKVVYLLFDSDRPAGNSNDGAGLAGMKRIANVLAQSTDQPKEVHYLHWGDGGFTDAKPTGYDIRDLLMGK